LPSTRQHCIVFSFISSKPSRIIFEQARTGSPRLLNSLTPSTTQTLAVPERRSTLLRPTTPTGVQSSSAV
jgi:hypothetical protein